MGNDRWIYRDESRTVSMHHMSENTAGRPDAIHNVRELLLCPCGQRCSHSGAPQNHRTAPGVWQRRFDGHNQSGQILNGLLVRQVLQVLETGIPVHERR